MAPVGPTLRLTGILWLLYCSTTPNELLTSSPQLLLLRLQGIAYNAVGLG